MRSLLITITIILSSFSISAQSLSEKVAAGGNPSLGFATAVPWGYPGENGEPLGFVNAIALTILEEMGINEVDTSVNEWAGLIPGLNAGRYDIITGGMYILKSRCENIDFSDPIGYFGDAMMVPAGNPKGIHNYEDVVRTGATLVTGIGFNTVEAAKKYGVPDSQMLLVDGEVGILAAMNAGRADVAVHTVFSVQEHVEISEGKFEQTDATKMPKEVMNVVGIGFRKSDSDFKEQFNAALAKVIGGEKWMSSTAEYGYTAAQLPPEGFTTEYACANK
jgi:polar amino acid transport system substrate-binding protein|tara:strand:- start:1 stop:831 length:831 start_codon:yes stop_codon:yes gene_type:complete